MTSPITDLLRGSKRVLLAEGVLLAISTAVAYGVAFAFEAGYADHFGYPHWLVEVSLSGVLIAWLAIVLTVGTLAVSLFNLISLLPARATRILLLNRTTALLGMAAGLMAWGDYVMSVSDDRWFGLGFGLALLLGGGISLAGMTIEFLRHFRRIVGLDDLLARLEAANNAWIESDRRKEAGSLSIQQALLGHRVGRVVGALFLLLSITLVAAMAAQGAGAWSARQESTWLVSGGEPAMVAVGRFGGAIIAMPLNRPQSALLRRFYLVPLADPHVLWTSRHLGMLRVMESLER